jgi:hypothetical protein
MAKRKQTFERAARKRKAKQRAKQVATLRAKETEAEQRGDAEARASDEREGD